MPIRFLCLQLLLLTVVASELTTAAETAQQKPRRYDRGPLKIEEFRQNPRESIPGKAQTMTRVMFTYEFRVKEMGPDRFEAKLTALDTFAVFLPEESWWNHRVSDSLLDHEQGHFDIAEITSRRIQLAFDRMFKSNQAINVKARTAALAKTALAEKLDKVMAVANEQTLRDNEAYDNQTSHGLRTNAQREYRRIQLLTLAKLQEDLAAPARKPRRANDFGQKKSDSPQTRGLHKDESSR